MEGGPGLDLGAADGGIGMAGIAAGRIASGVPLVAVGPGGGRTAIHIVGLASAAWRKSRDSGAPVAPLAVQGSGDLPVVRGHALGGALAVAVAVGGAAYPGRAVVGAASAGSYPGEVHETVDVVGVRADCGVAGHALGMAFGTAEVCSQNRGIVDMGTMLAACQGACAAGRATMAAGAVAWQRRSPLRCVQGSVVCGDLLISGAVAIQIGAGAERPRQALAGQKIGTITGIGAFGQMYNDPSLSHACGMREDEPGLVIGMAPDATIC